MANAQDLGTLAVVVLKARNLPDKHTFTKQDPYSIIELGPCKEQTEVDKRGGQHPIWDKDLRVRVLGAETKENRTMKVSCYAKEPKTDDLIGVGQIDITETLASGEFDDWVKLETNGAYRGEVYLEITFFAAGPPPLSRRASKLNPSERLWRPPQTPPKSAHNTPPARHAAELAPGIASPPKKYLTPPRGSPTLKADLPLPPIPDEIPASLLPAPARKAAGAGNGSGLNANEPARIPTILRPGGPSRPRPAAQHQRTSSIPTSPTFPQQQAQPTGPAHAPAYGNRTASDGYAPTQPAYTSPQPQPQHQASYTSPYPTVAPYPSVTPYPAASSYDPAPLGCAPSHSPSPAPAGYPTVHSHSPSPVPVQSPSYSGSMSMPGGGGGMRFSFPEPSISGPSYRPNQVQGYPSEPDRERDARLTSRYGSPLPLPPGAKHTPVQSSSTHTSSTSTPSHSRERNEGTSRPNTSSTPVPDSYLAKERAALARVQQEEADAEFARRLAAEAEDEEQPPPPPPHSQSAFATHSQPQAGSSKGKETETPGDTDEEFARRLARELNSDVIQAARRGSSDGNMPGGW